MKVKSTANILFIANVLAFMFPLISKAEDWKIIIYESMLNKVIATKNVWEWNDKKLGVNLKLSNLDLHLNNGNIIGTAILHEYKTAHQTSAKSLDGILADQISRMKDIAQIRFTTQIALSTDQKRLILKNTKLTSFDNKFLPRFLEKPIEIEINKKLEKEINGQPIYEITQQDMPVEITQMEVLKSGIIISGNLIPHNSNNVKRIKP